MRFAPALLVRPLLILALVILPAPAIAQAPAAQSTSQPQTSVKSVTLQAAQAAFAAGNFTQSARLARQAGESLQNADAFALAARATLVVAAYQTPDKAGAQALISKALDDAAAALRLDPGHVEGGLQRAIATGYQAKLDRSFRMGKATKALMLEMLDAHPENSFAWAMVGGWHSGTIYSAGSFLGSATLGASKSAAWTHFERAMQLDPQSPSFPVYFAFELLRLEKSQMARAERMLESAGTLAARDGFEQLMKRQGRQVLETLTRDGRDAALLQIDRLEPFGTLGGTSR